MSKPRLIFSQNKNETYIFTVNKPNTMKKSKYQQYFHCFTVCILVLYAFQFSYQQNIVTILNSAAFRGAALIRARRLFQCGYPKVRPLFETRCLLEEIGQQKMSRRKLHKTQILQNILILLEVYRSSCSQLFWCKFAVKYPQWSPIIIKLNNLCLYFTAILQGSDTSVSL